MTTTVDEAAGDQGRSLSLGAGAIAAGLGPIAVAGMASLGAGAIHAAAIGVHSEHEQVVRVFTVLAAAQIGWGALALVARRAVVAWAGLVLGVGAVAGWVLAKTSGISFVEGMEDAESIQFADAAAAALAALATVVVLHHLVSGFTGTGRVPGRGVMAVVAAGVLVVSTAAMASAGGHSHRGGDHHAGGADHHAGADLGAGGGHPGSGHEPAAVPPREYDPEAPIDLSGVDGVTETEQARAEKLIAITLDRLPHYADHQTAEADGFASIGDGRIGGHEHFVNWSYVNDEHILNPDYPESLVYRIGPDGSKQLVSAMFMLREGTRLDQVPEVGGKLTQWHVHNDLCFAEGPNGARLGGFTSVDGECRPPLEKLGATPMIHVWIVKHPCGPFAALEGVGAGQVAEGETHFCNAVHGSGH